MPPLRWREGCRCLPSPSADLPARCDSLSSTPERPAAARHPIPNDGSAALALLEGAPDGRLRLSPLPAPARPPSYKERAWRRLSGLSDTTGVGWKARKVSARERSARPGFTLAAISAISHGGDG